MPILEHHNASGHYFQYGDLAKYYYHPNSEHSRINAYRHALAQARAVKARQHANQF